MSAHAPLPWLSVIMPVYRGERWIEAALSSLAAQADDGIELLVLDSSPTSSTLDLARRFEDRIRIRFIKAGDLGSWHAKTNRGVAAARAEHICWLHHDDVWLPGRAAAVRAWIEAAPKAVLHISPSAIIDGDGGTLGIWRCPFSGDGALGPDDVLERLLVQNFVAAPSPVYRRDAFLACGGLDEDLWYTADWDLWLKLAASGPVHHHGAATAAFRVHSASLTVTGSRDAQDFEQQMRTVLDRHLPRIGDRSHSVRRAGDASIRVNAALAAASAGDPRKLLPAALSVLALGPRGLQHFMRDSRLADRVLPRMRARLAGAF